MKKREVYIVNFCDQWETYSSFTLLGVFSSRRKLNPILNDIIKSKVIECDCEVVNLLTDDELNSRLTYININKTSLNEIH